MTKRVALMGMHLEANSFAPPTTEQDFKTLCYLSGEEILADIALDNPSLPVEVAAFHDEMQLRGIDWEPLPILVTAAEPGGPADEHFFQRTKAEMQRRLEDAGPIDGVFCSLHGAMTSTGGDDPDGEVMGMVREVVGPDVPILSTLDLQEQHHIAGNIRMIFSGSRSD